MDREDRRFEIRSYTDAAGLHASLQRWGILEPLWVRARVGGRFIIVDGFKRFDWALKSGAESVPCRVFPADAPLADLMLRRIELKLFGPALNPAEKAQIVLKLEAAASPEEITSRFLPMIGAAPKPEIASTLRVLASRGERLLRAVATGEIFERAALELAAWEDGELVEALGIISTLRCSASIQMEIIERVTEIALRRGASRASLLRSPDLREILADRSLNHREKTRDVRSLLARLRFPRLSAREARFAKELAALDLPGAIGVEHPPAFEGDRWLLRLSFSTPEQLREFLTRSLDLADSPELKRLISPKSRGEEEEIDAAEKGRSRSA